VILRIKRQPCEFRIPWQQLIVEARRVSGDASLLRQDERI
jgi:hypothetical protein